MGSSNSKQFGYPLQQPFYPPLAKPPSRWFGGRKSKQERYGWNPFMANMPFAWPQQQQAYYQPQAMPFGNSAYVPGGQQAFVAPQYAMPQPILYPAAMNGGYPSDSERHRSRRSRDSSTRRRRRRRSEQQSSAPFIPSNMNGPVIPTAAGNAVPVIPNQPVAPPTTTTNAQGLPVGFVPADNGAGAPVGITGLPPPRPPSPPPPPNPLPTPPRDVWNEHTPYRTLLTELPATTEFLERSHTLSLEGRSGAGLQGRTDSENAPRRRTRPGFFGFGLRRNRDRDRDRREEGAAQFAVPGNMTGMGTGIGGANPGDAGGPSQPPPPSVMPTPVIPSSHRAPTPGPSNVPVTPGYSTARPTSPYPATMPSPGPNNASFAPQPPPPMPPAPPIHFTTESHPWLMNHSPHRILYGNRTYPSALHLLEALKFLPHRPDIAERLRLCTGGAQDVYPLSTRHDAEKRGDWGTVFRDVVAEVLYLKFKQHRDIRAALLETVGQELIYAHEDAYWGVGPDGNGANEMGKGLMRARDRLLEEAGR